MKTLISLLSVTLLTGCTPINRYYENNKYTPQERNKLWEEHLREWKNKNNLSYSPQTKPSYETDTAQPSKTLFSGDGSLLDKDKTADTYYHLEEDSLIKEKTYNINVNEVGK